MRFNFIAGALCLDFANTIHDSNAEDKEEELHSISDVLQWGKEAGLLSSTEYDRLAEHYDRNQREAATALAKSKAIRDLLLSTFAAIANGRSVSSQRVADLNSALVEAPGLLRIQKKHDRLEAKWTSAHSGLQQLCFALVTNAAELIASDRLARVRECASEDCTWLFVDDSRNGSRRWCEMSSCGNRMKARRFYQRAKAEQ